MKNVSFDILLNLKDNITAGLNKVREAMREVDEDVRRVTESTGRFGDVMDGMKWMNINAIVDIFSKLGNTLSSVTDKGFSFGQSMADLSSITGIAGDDLTQLEENARKFGADSGLGADTAARAYSILASQIQVSAIGMDGLNNLEEKSIMLAQAAGMSMDSAAESLAGTINQFGLGADSAERIINVLAAGSKYGAAEISELSQSFKVVGAAASAMGMDVESTAGALEVLSQANLKGSEAGTALRNIILKLNTELGVDLGETSLGTALDALKLKLTDATYLSKVFGMENIAAAQFLIQNADAVDTMTARLTNTNVAQEQAAIRTETNSQVLARMRARMDDVKIGISQAMGSLAPYVAMITENAEAISMTITLGGQAIGMITRMTLVVGKLTGSTLAHTVAVKASAVAVKAASLASKTWSLVQAGLNAVLTANPIGMVIMALAALTTALIAAYNNCEDFRKVCDRVWSVVRNIASAVFDYLVKAFESACTIIRKAWEWVRKFFGFNGDMGSSTDSIEKNTEAVEGNTAAKKKALALNFDTDKPKTAKPVKVQGLSVGAEGSSSYLENLISQKEMAFKFAVDPESRRQIWEEIERLTSQKTEIEFRAKFVMPKTDFKKNDSLLSAGKGMELPDKISVAPYFNSYADALEKAGQAQEQFRTGSQAVSEAIGNMGGAIGGWLQYGAGVVNAIGQAIPAIMSLIGAQAAEQAQSEASTATNVAEASSQAMKAHSGIPFVGVAMGVAAVAAIIAAMMSIPKKFANGAIAYGPTLGLFGEYPGASNNPEVVAPLNKLKTLIQPAGGNISGKVVFKIDGRSLKGVLEKENRLDQRS